MYILGFRPIYDKLVDTVGETINVTTAKCQLDSL